MAKIQAIEMRGRVCGIPSDELGDLIKNGFEGFDVDDNGVLTKDEIEQGLAFDPLLEKTLLEKLDKLQAARNTYVDDSVPDAFLSACVRSQNYDSSVDKLFCHLSKLFAASNETIFRTLAPDIHPIKQYIAQVNAADDLGLNAQSVAADMGTQETDSVKKYCVEPFVSTGVGKTLCDEFKNNDYGSVLQLYGKVFGLTSSIGDCFYKAIEKNGAGNPLRYTKIPDITLKESGAVLFNKGFPLFDLVLSAINATDSLTLSAYLLNWNNVPSEDYFSDAAYFAVTCDNFTAKELLGKYMPLVDAALDVVVKAHPDVRFSNLKAMYLNHFSHEMSAISMLDVWQDMSACASVGCDHMRSFSEVFSQFGDPKILGLWQATSLAFRNKQNQGYGPAQIILGLAMEAVEDERVSARYRDLLPPDAFDGEDGMLRTIISPEGSIACLAMVYDFMFTRLEETLLADPEFGFSSYSYPFISDENTLREMALIQLAKMLIVFPENDNISKIILMNGPKNSVWSKAFMVGKEFGVELEIPEVTFKERKYSMLSAVAGNDEKLSGVPVMSSDNILLMMPEDSAHTIQKKCELIANDSAKFIFNAALAVAGLEITPSGNLTTY